MPRTMLARSLGLALALLGATAALAASADPPAGNGPWVVRARFQDRAQVNRLAAEREPWEVHYDQRYLVLDVDADGWRFLVSLGFEPEVDEARTAAMLRPRVALPGQVNAIPGFPCYRTWRRRSPRPRPSSRRTRRWPRGPTSGTAGKQQAGGLPGLRHDGAGAHQRRDARPKPKLLITSASTPASTPPRADDALRRVPGRPYDVDPDVTCFLDHQECTWSCRPTPTGASTGGGTVLAQEHRALTADRPKLGGPT